MHNIIQKITDVINDIGIEIQNLDADRLKLIGDLENKTANESLINTIDSKIDKLNGVNGKLVGIANTIRDINNTANLLKDGSYTVDITTPNGIHVALSSILKPNAIETGDNDVIDDNNSNLHINIIETDNDNLKSTFEYMKMWADMVKSHMCVKNQPRNFYEEAKAEIAKYDFVDTFVGNNGITVFNGGKMRIIENRLAIIQHLQKSINDPSMVGDADKDAIIQCIKMLNSITEMLRDNFKPII